MGNLAEKLSIICLLEISHESKPDLANFFRWKDFLKIFFCLSFGGLWDVEGVKEMVLLLFVLSCLSKFIHVHATLLGDLEAEKYACNFALGNRKRCCNAWKFQIKVFV